MRLRPQQGRLAVDDPGRELPAPSPAVRTSVPRGLTYRVSSRCPSRPIEHTPPLPPSTFVPRLLTAPVFRLPTRVLISGAVVLRPPDNHRFSALQTPRASAAEAYFHPLFVPRSYPRPAQGFHPPYTALWTKFVDKASALCGCKRHEGMGLTHWFVLIAKLAQHRVVLVEFVIAKAINSGVSPLCAFGV